MNRLPLYRILGPLLAIAAVAGGQTIEATVGVGRQPSAVVYDSLNSRLYVAVKGDNKVSVIDTSNRVVKTIPVGANPSALCWNPAAGKVYVANSVLSASGTVSIISTATDSVIATVDVGEDPVAFAWSATRNKVYCVNGASHTVSVIDGVNNDVLTVLYLEQRLNRIIYNPVNDRVYVTSGGYREPGNVTVIDCENDEVLTTVSTGNNANAYGLAHNAESNRLYVTNAGTGTLWIIDCANNQRLGVLQAGTEPKAVTWLPNKVFWASYWTYSLRFMHGDSLRIRGTTTLTGGPAEMLYNPATRKLFAACPLASKVVVIDARDQHELRVITELTTGSGPTTMAVCPSRNRLYVANFWDTTVTVIRDVVGIAEPGSPGAPAALAASARPCPAGRGSRVAFDAPGFAPTRLEIRDALGRTVHAGAAGAETRWTVTVVPGVYFYVLADPDAGAQASGRLVVR